MAGEDREGSGATAVMDREEAEVLGLPDIDLDAIRADRVAVKDRLADALRTAIEARREIPLSEIRDWLKKHDAEDTKLVFYGSGSGRNWWHSDAPNNVLLAGAKPKAPEKTPAAGNPRIASGPQKQPERAPALTDPNALQDPKDQMENIAIQVGIHPQHARTMAGYLSQSFDIDDARSMWTGLDEIKEITPAMRRRFLRTWCSMRGIDIAPDLAKKVDDLGTAGAPPPPPLPKAAKLFVAIDGAVIATENDDPDGLTFNQAMAMARQQAALGPQPDPEERPATMMGQMMSGMAALIGVLKDKAPAASPGNDEVAKLRLEMLEERRRHDKELEDLRRKGDEEKRERDAKELRDDIKALGAQIAQVRNAPPPEKAKSFTDMLFDEMPEAKTKFFNVLMGRDEGKASGHFPVTYDAQGRPLMADFATMRELKKLEAQEKGLKLLEEKAPEMIDTIKLMAQAYWDERQEKKGIVPAAKAPPAGQGKEPTEASIVCGHCQTRIRVALVPGISGVECPKCLAAIDLDGKVVVPPPEEEKKPLVTAPPAPAMQAPKEEPPATAAPVPAPAPTPPPPPAAAAATPPPAISTNAADIVHPALAGSATEWRP